MKHSTGIGGTLLISAVVLSLGAGIRERVRLLQAIDDLAEVEERAQYLGTYREALLAQLNRVKLGSPFLTAEVVVGLPEDRALRLDSGNVVLCYLSTDCPFCPTNYEFLNRLATSGVPVVGLAFDPVEGAVETHHREWNLQFPIFVNPVGTVVEMVPRYGTPTIVVVSQGKVAFLEFGELRDGAQRSLKAIADSWEPPSQVRGSGDSNF